MLYKQKIDKKHWSNALYFCRVAVIMVSTLKFTKFYKKRHILNTLKTH